MNLKTKRILGKLFFIPASLATLLLVSFIPRYLCTLFRTFHPWKFLDLPIDMFGEFVVEVIAVFLYFLVGTKMVPRDWEKRVVYILFVILLLIESVSLVIVISAWRENGFCGETLLTLVRIVTAVAMGLYVISKQKKNKSLEKML